MKVKNVSGEILEALWIFFLNIFCLNRSKQQVFDLRSRQVWTIPCLDRKIESMYFWAAFALGLKTLWMKVWQRTSQTEYEQQLNKWKYLADTETTYIWSLFPRSTLNKKDVQLFSGQPHFCAGLHKESYSPCPTRRKKKTQKTRQRKQNQLWTKIGKAWRSLTQKWAEASWQQDLTHLNQGVEELITKG